MNAPPRKNMGNVDYHVKYVKAFKDNYIWLILNNESTRCIAIDPGESSGLINFLSDNNISLESVWITHHHSDHCGGIQTLKDTFNIKIYGPKNENIPGVDIKVGENDCLQPSFTKTTFRVMEIPGHTRGHIAYYSSRDLFCGDTLFSAGCGRLFEGTAEQLHFSLNKICQLPENTLIFCAHEYTLNNLLFSKTVDPNNAYISETIEAVKNLISEHKPSLPTTLAHEKRINPFLRCDVKDIILNVEKHFNFTLNNEVDVFRYLRLWKDSFKAQE